MTSAAPAFGQQLPSRRRISRCHVDAPLDITVLRSGIPDVVPGRALNLGAGGIAAVVAGELSPGELVALEIRLPQAANPVRTRAVVRHNDPTRCGMEFVELSTEQQSAIREFTERSQARAERSGESENSIETLPGPETSEIVPLDGGAPPPSSPKPRSRGWTFLFLSIAVLTSVLFWRWNRGWEELESGLRENKVTAQPQAQVPADAMAKLVRHRVDPDYPDAARPGKLQGIIVLDVIVGTDGTVLNVRALNGPDILAQSAIDAMRWWRFAPYRVGGQPVIAETTVAMEFKP